MEETNHYLAKNNILEKYIEYILAKITDKNLDKVHQVLASC